MVSYVVVEFIKTKQAGVVPENWIKDGYCFWPPAEIGKKLQPILEKGVMVTCGATWDRHPVTTRGETYDSWKIANKKLKKFLETSDIDTTDVDELGKGKRKVFINKKKTKASVSPSSDSEDEIQIADPPRFQPCPNSESQMLDQDSESEELSPDTQDLLQNQPEPSEIEDTPSFLPLPSSGKRMPGLVEVEEDHLSLHTEELLQSHSESLLGEYANFCQGLPSTLNRNHTVGSKTSTQIYEPTASSTCAALSHVNSEYLLPSHHPLKKRKFSKNDSMTSISPGQSITEHVHCSESLGNELPAKDSSSCRKSEYLLPSHHPLKKRKFSKNISMTSITPGQSITEQFHGSQKMDASTPRAKDASTNRDSESFLPPKSPIKKGKLPKDKESQPMTAFEQRMLRNMEILKMKMDNLNEGMEILLHRHRTIENAPHCGFEGIKALIELMPLSNISDLATMERELSNKEKFEEMKLFLKTIGGMNTDQMVRNILNKVLTNGIALHYSFLGRREKAPFKETNLYKVMLGAVFLHPNVKDASEFVINRSIQSWLRHAKARLKVV